MKRMNLLIYNQHASYITIDIANAFVKSGYYSNLVLMAGVINVRDDKLNEKIRVVKTVKYVKTNILTRFVSWFFSFIHFILTITFKYRSYDLFLISNPPLISFLPWFLNNSFSALVFDIYPDALASSGFVSEKSIIYSIWRKANLRYYKRARRVFTISDGMKKRLEQYCEPSKIEVVSLWSSFTPHQIPKEENEFIMQNNLKDKFIVMYSGNMGKGIGLHTIVDVAQKLQPENDILFFFIGEGWIMGELKSRVNDLGLVNCIFMPYQDASILKHSLSAADISIVALPPSASSISIPNKTYTLLALGRLLLCITSEKSDLCRLVRNYEIGRCFDEKDTDQIVEFILKIKNDLSYRSHLSNNVYKCSGLFTKSNASMFTDRKLV